MHGRVERADFVVESEAATNALADPAIACVWVDGDEINRLLRHKPPRDNRMKFGSRRDFEQMRVEVVGF